MRILRKDNAQVFIFSSPEERDQYFEEVAKQEYTRHAEAIRDIHADYMNEVKAENSYYEGTISKIRSLKEKSLLEAQVKEKE